MVTFFRAVSPEDSDIVENPPITKGIKIVLITLTTYVIYSHLAPDEKIIVSSKTSLVQNINLLYETSLLSSSYFYHNLS